MAHIRTQIRQVLKEVLEVNLGTGYSVFASRQHAINPTKKAIIDMRFQNVNVEAQTMGAERMHEASLYVRCIRTAMAENMDDLFDADEVAINAAIQAQDWSQILEEQPELTQVNFSDDSSAGSVGGAIVLRYDLQYRATIDDLETVRA